MVDPFTPYGSKDMRDDLGPIIGTRNPLAVAKFHVEVSRALRWALKNGHLAEGRYHVAHLDNTTIEDKMIEIAGGKKNLSPQYILALRKDLPQLDPEGMFTITTAHILLLKNLRFGWDPDGMRGYSWEGWHQVPVVNFKRPFGVATAFELDMADILNIPASKPGAGSDPALWRLYTEMWLVLQVFVEHAQIPVAQQPEGRLDEN
jgi:hypothetical protein